MAKTIVGLYETLTAARKIVSDLQDSGVPRENISLIASDSAGEYSRYFDTHTELTTDKRDVVAEQTDTDVEDEIVSDAGAGAARGAGAGAVVGGVAGLLVGLGLLAIPGIGPVVAAGPILSALAGAGIGAATGGLVGALVKAGVPEHEAERYAEGVRRGGALVSVNAPDDMVEQVNEIMSRYNPINVREPAVERRSDMTSANEDFTVGRDFDTHENDFREHYEQHYATSDYEYEQYLLAYRYGYDLYSDERYRGRNWNDIEADARRDWERQNIGSKWEDFKDAIREGWDRVRGKR